jgi:hypothetical protein
MARNVIQLTVVQDTPQGWEGLKGLVLTPDQMKEWGLIVTNFCTDELATLRRCQLCRRMSSFVRYVPSTQVALVFISLTEIYRSDFLKAEEGFL